MKKVVIYSHDTYGLGNIRRMLAIAKYLVDNDPEMSILVLSGSPMLHAFRIPPRIDYVKLPCLRRTSNGGYAVKHLGLELNPTLQLRSSIIVSALTHFQPDLIMVDKKPLGVCDELAPALNFVQRSGMKTKLVLLLRDIIDRSDVTSRIWEKNGYYGLIEKFYDRVLVVGSQDIFDLGKEYRCPPSCLEKIRYCGYLSRDQGARGKQAIKKELGIGQEKFVLVTPGGGEDGFNLIVNYLQGLGRMTGDPGFKTLVIHGPEMSKDNQRVLHTLAGRRPQVILKEYTDDMMSYMNAADLVVSMGGYNTVCEILTLKKRAVVVPRTNPVEEQWIRARRMARHGLFQFIHPDHASPAALMDAVHGNLGSAPGRNGSPRGLDMKGMAAIAQQVSLAIHPSRDLYLQFTRDQYKSLMAAN